MASASPSGNIREAPRTSSLSCDLFPVSLCCSHTFAFAFRPSHSGSFSLSLSYSLFNSLLVLAWDGDLWIKTPVGVCGILAIGHALQTADAAKTAWCAPLPLDCCFPRFNRGANGVCGWRPCSWCSTTLIPLTAGEKTYVEEGLAS